MNKTFRVRIGHRITLFIGTCLTIVIILLMLANIHQVSWNTRTFLGLIIFTLALIVFAYSFKDILKPFFYKIIVTREKLIEKNVFSKEREILIGDITAINHAEYSSFYSHSHRKWLIYLYEKLMAIVSSIRPGSSGRYTEPMIRIVGLNKFPKYPIDTKIVDVLLELKPSISVDPKLRDLLSSSVRKKLGLELTVQYKLGLVLWRISLSILGIIVFGIIFILL